MKRITIHKNSYNNDEQSLHLLKKKKHDQISTKDIYINKLFYCNSS